MNSYKIISNGFDSGSPDISIAILAYNHEQYIVQAIESIFMQKTSYVYEIVIAEDCSTDNTRAIIVKYKEQHPHIFKLILQNKNAGATKNTISLFENTKGRYVAFLEGDDYWTDPLKLQKQVDFLERNPDYSLCGHRYKLYSQNSDTYADDSNGDLFKNDETGFGFDLQYFFKRWLIQPLSLVFRREALDINYMQRLTHYFDYVLLYQLMTKGRGYLFGFFGGTYRKHDAGMHTSTNDLKYFKWHYEAFKDLYNIERTNLLKEVYLYNAFKYTHAYIKYSKQLSFKHIKSIITEQLKLDSSLKKMRKLVYDILKTFLVRIVKNTPVKY